MNLKTTTAFILYLVTLTMIAYYALNRPAFQWDMVAYTGCVLSYEEHDKNVIHQKAYQIVKESVPKYNYELLTEGSDYRTAVFKNPDSYNQQLNLYHVKPLYVFILYLCYKSGLNIVHSTLWISIISSMLVSLITLFWLKRNMKGILPFVVSFLLVNAANIYSVARESTPDGLSSLLIIIAMFFLLEKKNLFIHLIFQFLALLTRPDNIILILITILYLRFTYLEDYKIKNPAFIFSLVFFLLTYIFVNLSAHSYGWWKFFSHSFFKEDPNIAYTIYNFSFIKYVFRMIQGLPQFAHQTPSIFLLLAIITFYLTCFKLKSEKIYTHIILMVYLIIILRFLLYPIMLDRHFMIYYLVIGIMSIIMIVNKRRTMLSDKLFEKV